MSNHTLNRPIALLGLLLGLVGLVLEFDAIVPPWLNEGLPTQLAVFRYFSYLTILSNIGLVLAYSATLWRRVTWLSWFRTPLFRAAMAGIITLVMVYYHVFLRGNTAPDVLAQTATTMLHYASPILYLLWFALFSRSGTLHFKDMLVMLALPLAYFVFVLLRGAVLGEYPYAILDVAKYGYGRIGLNALIFTFIFAALYAIAILVDRLMPHRNTL